MLLLQLTGFLRPFQVDSEHGLDLKCGRGRQRSCTDLAFLHTHHLNDTERIKVPPKRSTETSQLQSHQTSLLVCKNHISFPSCLLAIPCTSSLSTPPSYAEDICVLSLLDCPSHVPPQHRRGSAFWLLLNATHELAPTAGLQASQVKATSDQHVPPLPPQP